MAPPTDHEHQNSSKRIADVIDIRKSYVDRKATVDKKTGEDNFVNYLFNRFLFIWGIKWANKIADVEDAARDEWADAIKGLSDKQIKAGIAAARNQCEWPPEISQFLPLCKGESIVQPNHFNCLVMSCPDAGTMCASPWGTNWVCNKHFHEGKG